MASTRFMCLDWFATRRAASCRRASAAANTTPSAPADAASAVFAARLSHADPVRMRKTAGSAAKSCGVRDAACPLSTG
jgi:hypothetical protein